MYSMYMYIREDDRILSFSLDLAQNMLMIRKTNGNQGCRMQAVEKTLFSDQGRAGQERISLKRAKMY
jgi:hypothetical protein